MAQASWLANKPCGMLHGTCAHALVERRCGRKDQAQLLGKSNLVFQILDRVRAQICAWTGAH